MTIGLTIIGRIIDWRPTAWSWRPTASSSKPISWAPIFAIRSATAECQSKSPDDRQNTVGRGVLVAGLIRQTTGDG